MDLVGSRGAQQMNHLSPFDEGQLGEGHDPVTVKGRLEYVIVPNRVGFGRNLNGWCEKPIILQGHEFEKAVFENRGISGK